MIKIILTIMLGILAIGGSGVSFLALTDAEGRGGKVAAVCACIVGAAAAGIVTIWL